MERNHFEERRRSLRVAGNIPLKISCGDFDLVTESQNLSSRGAYCSIDQYIEPMTKLKLQLLLPFKRKDKTVTKKVSCGGVIVRTEAIPGSQKYHIAVFFNDIQTRDADTISEYVLHILSREPSARV